MTLDLIADKVMHIKAQRDALKGILDSDLKAYAALEARKADIEEATALIQEVARSTQNRLQQRFQDIVQSALDCVFQDTYTFKLEFIAKRGKTEVDMWLDKDGTRMDIVDSNGGGVVDVICFALRIVCLTLSTTDRVLILDEPFKHLRGDARKRLGELVRSISDKIGIQIIMVADVAGTSIIADKVFSVSMQKRQSVISEIGNEASC